MAQFDTIISCIKFQLKFKESNMKRIKLLVLLLIGFQSKIYCAQEEKDQDHSYEQERQVIIDTTYQNGPGLIDGFAFLQSQAMVNINDMLRNGELSAVSVTIDPTQNVASTSNVNITIKIVPIGVARTITIKIAYAASL